MVLTEAGVQFDQQRIKVNRFLSTNVSHIYAIGDVVGHDRSSRTAIYHARLAIHNIRQQKTKHKTALNYNGFVRHLNLTPEVAACGLTEKELLQREQAYLKAVVDIKEVARSWFDPQAEGFVKLLTSPEGSILGASAVAPMAGEIINEISLALRLAAKASDLNHSCRAFPTWSEIWSLACQRLQAT